VIFSYYLDFHDQFFKLILFDFFFIFYFMSGFLHCIHKLLRLRPISWMNPTMALPVMPRAETGTVNCNKIFLIVPKGHICCSQECTKSRQASIRLTANTSSSSANGAVNKPNNRKKSISSPDKVDSNGMKKLKADSDSVLTFIS